MDFAQLRQNIFEGEDDEDVDTRTPVRDELRQTSVGFPLILGAGALILWGVDRFMQNGELLEKEGEYNYRPVVVTLLGALPFGYGLGQLMRGLKCQDEVEKYEQLVETAEAEMEKLESEVVEMEQQREAEAQQKAAEASTNFGGVNFFMSAENATGTSTQGVYGSAFGQQPVHTRPDFQRTAFGF